jgi:hypothetical protein
METLLSVNFWLSAFLYAVSLLFVFILPGLVVTLSLKSRLKPVSRFLIAIALGMGMWGAQAYVFGYLHLRLLTYGYIVLFLILSLLRQKKILSFFRLFGKDVMKIDRLSVLLITIGIIIQCMQMWGTGLQTKEGMPFYRVHAQDGIYHLSLIASLKRSFPPIEPGATGIPVVNYHYWSDMILAEQSRIFLIPVENLFFQFTPLFISLGTALAVWSLIREMGGNKTLIRFSIFFVFFGADLGFIVAYLIHHVVSFQYPVIDNGATQFLNMPHTIAKMVFFIGLLSFKQWLGIKNVKWGTLTALLFAFLFGLKIYFALFAVIGSLLVGVGYGVRFIVMKLRKKRLPAYVWKNEWVFLLRYAFFIAVFGIIALCIYLPPNRNSGGLGYYPLEWPRLFLSEANLDWREWRYRHAIYEYYHNTKAIIVYDALAILACLVSIYGTRILGYVPTKKLFQFLGWEFSLFLIPGILIFTFLGLYTLQKSGSFNVFNFFVVALVPLALFSAFHLAKLWEKKMLLYRLLVVGVLLLSLPRIWFETEKIVSSYRLHTDVTTISKGEQAALAFIAREGGPQAIVQSVPNNGLDMHTPYVSFYANHETYISGQSVLETHNQPTQSRLDEVNALFATHDAGRLVQGLKDRHITYLYVRTQDIETIPSSLERYGATIRYENADARVYSLQ